jgi:hypothetical protein
LLERVRSIYLGPQQVKPMEAPSDPGPFSYAWRRAVTESNFVALAIKKKGIRFI